MTAPTPAVLADSLPLPLANWRAGRRRQVQRLTAERDQYPATSPDWRQLNSRLVFAARRLAELEAR
ncbi:hypothetical protein [uncultured Modestobacter sp.]|uniref:hypothetical protein n=1 Tax=uncultured Modestobacter sp. TaxID=380048 RepID=UPI002612757E|nr:hypothetical protein [uncultured Modestobacter sp.]